MFCAVMEAASSLNRNLIVAATEAVVVGRFSDVRLYIRSLWSAVSVELISVSIKPATRAFERMPRSPHSRAVFLENASSAPFVEAYIASPLYPVCTLIEEMCTMLPIVPCNKKWRMAYFVINIGAKTFTWYMS